MSLVIVKHIGDSDAVARRHRNKSMGPVRTVVGKEDSVDGLARIMASRVVLRTEIIDLKLIRGHNRGGSYQSEL